MKPTLSVFFRLGCIKCGWDVWVEAGGLARPRWDGSCPKCHKNAWAYHGQTTNKMEGIGSALDDLLAENDP